MSIMYCMVKPLTPHHPRSIQSLWSAKHSNCSLICYWWRIDAMKAKKMRLVNTFPAVYRPSLICCSYGNYTSQCLLLLLWITLFRPWCNILIPPCVSFGRLMPKKHSSLVLVKELEKSQLHVSWTLSSTRWNTWSQRVTLTTSDLWPRNTMLMLLWHLFSWLFINLLQMIRFLPTDSNYVCCHQKGKWWWWWWWRWWWH